MEQCKRCGELVEYETLKDGEYCPKCGWERQAAAKFSKDHPQGSVARKAIDESIYSIGYLDGGFKYKDVEYKYSDLQSIGFAANDTRIRHSLVFSTYAQSAQIKMEFVNRKKLLVGTASGSARRPEGVSGEQDFLFRTYLKLVKDSIPFRIEKYHLEFRHSGFLLWNGIKWFVGELEKGKVRYHTTIWIS